jgi:hypothetical protein
VAQRRKVSYATFVKKWPVERLIRRLIVELIRANETLLLRGEFRLKRTLIERDCIREGAAMPARRRPQLDHQSLKFGEIFGRFHEDLCDGKRVVLERVGFYNEFGYPGEETYTGSIEGIELIRELAGILTRAAVIRVDAGFKAARKVIATLEAIVDDPGLLFLETTEPEARGVVAAAYQRADEPPGTCWTDVDICDEENEVILDRIRMAANCGILTLQAQAKSGRSVEWDIQYLAGRLREIFLRFNDRITRKSVQSSRGDGDYFQKEEGRFFLFLEAVLAPLNRFLAGLPAAEDVSVRALSAEYIAKRAVAVPQGGGSPNYVHN